MIACGGIGNDVFVLVSNGGFDTIGDFTVGEDRLALALGLTFDLLRITQGEGATFISLSRREGLAAILAVKLVRSPLIQSSPAMIIWRIMGYYRRSRNLYIFCWG